MDLSNQQIVLEDPPPTQQTLKLHKDLHKAESSLLVQIRTARIGLAKFLYNCKVPGIVSAKCKCSVRHKTPWHIALFCVREASRRQFLKDQAGRALPWSTLISTADGAKRFVQ